MTTKEIARARARIAADRARVAADRPIRTLAATAARIRVAAQEWSAWHQAEYGGGKEPEMVAVGEADASDLELVAELVERGEVDAAGRHLASLDTIVRDQVDPQTYRALMRAAFGEDAGRTGSL